MTHGEMLKILNETGALLEGHFELRSRLHSDRYFQCAYLLCYPRHAETMCGALARKLEARLGKPLKANGVIAPALGGILVGHELARALNVRSIFAEKEEDKLALRRFQIGQGERYIVAEDVVTRGGRVDETARIVKDHGGEVVAVAVLVDRSGGKAKFPWPTVSLLEMDPVTYEPAQCPLCAQGIPIKHPGS
ncbi:MAG: orotate phosphoribosyltransferase [Verrucomicrobiota bacterium]|nr:orotate phosphoribosyltransferase [Verrucomicrobiota bacterium]